MERIIPCLHFPTIAKESGRKKKQWNNVSILTRAATFSSSFYLIIIRYGSVPSPSIRPRNHLLSRRPMKNSSPLTCTYSKTFLNRELTFAFDFSHERSRYFHALIAIELSLCPYCLSVSLLSHIETVIKRCENRRE